MMASLGVSGRKMRMGTAAAASRPDAALRHPTCTGCLGKPKGHGKPWGHQGTGGPHRKTRTEVSVSAHQTLMASQLHGAWGRGITFSFC